MQDCPSHLARGLFTKPVGQLSQGQVTMTTYTLENVVNGNISPRGPARGGVAAAWKMIEKEGVAGLSVREAARRAGRLAQRSLPPLCRSRSAARRAGGGRLRAVELARSRTDAGRELGEAYVAFALEHPQRFRLMFSRGRARCRRSGAVRGLRFAHLGVGRRSARRCGLVAGPWFRLRWSWRGSSRRATTSCARSWARCASPRRLSARRRRGTPCRTRPGRRGSAAAGTRAA